MSNHSTSDHAYDPLLADIEDRAWSWKNRPGYKPILFITATLVFAILVIMPTAPEHAGDGQNGKSLRVCPCRREPKRLPMQ